MKKQEYRFSALLASVAIEQLSICWMNPIN